MSSPIYRSTAAVIAFVGTVSSIPALAQAQDTGRTLTNNEAIFIDGQALTVTPGRSQDDVLRHLGNLNVHPLGAGAIVFRSGNKLYVVDGAPMGAAMAMYDPAIERQRSYGGLEDPAIERQRSYGGLNDPAIERQRSYGGLNDPVIERQRSYGGLYDPAIERQRSYGGFYDSAAEWRRQQTYGGLYDPDYANYRLKKMFGAVWSPTSKN